MTTKEKHENKYNSCPLTHSLNIIGGKWRLPIIWQLSQHEKLRYNSLKRNIIGITNMMLTKSLKDLEAYGVVSRIQFAEIPPRVEYSLTQNGKNLVPTLKSLANWGKEMQHVVSINNKNND